MRLPHLAGRLLLAGASAALAVRDGAAAGGCAVNRWPPLARLRAAIGRLPPGLALPLFLVPELCSRSGWAVSAWLLWQGHPGRAMAVYAGTKLLAGGSALWIYFACEPALLRVPWFAAMHRAGGMLRRALVGWVRRRLPSGTARLRPRSAAPAPAPAMPSSPAVPGRTK